MEREMQTYSDRRSEITAAQLTRVLQEVFGFRSFREHQEETIGAILKNRDAFVVMPTGGGKSLCFQLPAYVLSGTCLVISPLISLMKDQVEAARITGLRAAFLNSSQSTVQRRRAMQSLETGDLDLIYVAPERFVMKSFQELLGRIELSFTAIDEAHCISEWGHDFRPDYLALSEVVKRFPNSPVAAFTATATRRVQRDIIEKLGLRNPRIIRASFNRANLFYRVVLKEDLSTQVISFLKEHRRESGIIYRTTRRDVENTAATLRRHGFSVLPYHAGLEDDVRTANQDAFNRDDVDIIVATIAFGMGIDKSNVRFVVHGDLPKNMESYYQETGRSGRDGELAHCQLFFGRGDIPRIRHFIDRIDDETERQFRLRCLNEMVKYAEVNACRRQQLLAYFGETYPESNCGMCDVCLGEVERTKVTSAAQKALSAIFRSGERFGRRHVIDILTGSLSEKVVRQRHDELKTFGVGRTRTKQYWWRIIDDLMAQGYVQQSGDQFPVLKLDRKAKAVLLGEEDFHVLRRTKPTKKLKRVGFETYDEGLFETLRNLRRRLAAKRRIPPYLVFTDRTLREMAHFCPTTEEEMRLITGVGEHKLKLYGRPFIAEIELYQRRESGA
jgi:ATP-dependent DNA helicase RecQ